MSAPRLELALSTGGLSLPSAGRIAVFAPRAGQDLSALPKDRIQVITGFAPDHAALSAAGYDCAVTPGGEYAAAVVFLPRAKALAQALVAEASQVAGLVIVDGTKTDGVESILKAVRKRVEVEGPLNKAHGKLFWFSGADLSDWATTGPAQIDGGWTTAPGVFSADGVDPASALLASALPGGLSGRVADLGAGWGYLSARMLADQPGIKSLDLVEADHAALDCARINVTDPRARFHWADATTWRPEAALDFVVTNPPFHNTRAADPRIGQGFVRAAAAMLRPGGRLWMVANRHLPYEDTLAESFGKAEEIAGDNRFKILTATRAARLVRRDRVT